MTRPQRNRYLCGESDRGCIKDHYPLRLLATVELSSRVRVNGEGVKLVMRVITHNCRSSEQSIAVGSWTRTHRLCVAKLEDGDTDDLHDGEVPIL